ncbi:MAG: M23 family metallopeptidase [Clostridia bacterium]|nr:M23 family metallopeptidase [Clostridia bacterium]
MKNNKAILFFRRNAVYLILAFCILAIGLSAILMTTNGKNNVADVPVITPDTEQENPSDDDNTPTDTVITFVMPVSNATGIDEYSEIPVFNPTLNRYEAHLGLDFFAPEGSSVCAVYDGTILSVENTLLHGTTITIDHGNGLKTVYNSLEDGDLVTVGSKVSQGEVIGAVSITNKQEYKEGAHLHFEVYENDVNIDPAKYLVYEEK